MSDDILDDDDIPPEYLLNRIKNIKTFFGVINLCEELIVDIVDTDFSKFKSIALKWLIYFITTAQGLAQEDVKKRMGVQAYHSGDNLNKVQTFENSILQLFGSQDQSTYEKKIKEKMSDIDFDKPLDVDSYKFCPSLALSTTDIDNYKKLQQFANNLHLTLGLSHFVPCKLYYNMQHLPRKFKLCRGYMILKSYICVGYITHSRYQVTDLLLNDGQDKPELEVRTTVVNYDFIEKSTSKGRIHKRFRFHSPNAEPATKLICLHGQDDAPTTHEVAREVVRAFSNNLAEHPLWLICCPDLAERADIRMIEEMATTDRAPLFGEELYVDQQHYAIDLLYVRLVGKSPLQVYPPISERIFKCLEFLFSYSSVSAADYLSLRYVHAESCVNKAVNKTEVHNPSITVQDVVFRQKFNNEKINAKSRLQEAAMFTFLTFKRDIKAWIGSVDCTVLFNGVTISTKTFNDVVFDFPCRMKVEFEPCKSKEIIIESGELLEQERSLVENVASILREHDTPPEARSFKHALQKEQIENVGVEMTQNDNTECIYYISIEDEIGRRREVERERDRDILLIYKKAQKAKMHFAFKGLEILLPKSQEILLPKSHEEIKEDLKVKMLKRTTFTML